MLTKEERIFLEYWEANRERKKSVWHYLSAGLPMGLTIAATILINIFSDWFKRASRVINTDPDTMIVILVAAVIIVTFIVFFSVRYKWDINEQYYRELLAKKDLT
ncbi:MAG: hypothetical protein IPM85_11850 [Chitinophagaceae bacterium]|nr:hypothetical protein [Chitinophagaceae bacterium]